MKKTLLYTTAAAALFLAPVSAMAQSNTGSGSGSGTSTQQTTGGQQNSVDAGSLIGREVEDAQGNSVGEIDSVMVDQQGKVQSVVLDVSGWLETEKLISVPWKDLTVNTEGDVISTSLTKEQANSATAYRYRNEAYRGGLLTESGERYSGTGSMASGTGTSGSGSSGTTTGTTGTTGSGSSTSSTASGTGSSGSGTSGTGTTGSTGTGDTGSTYGTGTTGSSASGAGTSGTDTTTTTGTTGTGTGTTTGTSGSSDTGGALSGLTGGDRVTNPDGSLNMSRLIGLDVRNGQNENIGDVREVVLDQDGKIKGIVIDVGGFLGVGARSVFLNWDEIQLQQNQGETVAMVQMSKDRIQAMPEYPSTSQ